MLKGSHTFTNWTKKATVWPAIPSQPMLVLISSHPELVSRPGHPGVCGGWAGLKTSSQEQVTPSPGWVGLKWCPHRSGHNGDKHISLLPFGRSRGKRLWQVSHGTEQKVIHWTPQILYQMKLAGNLYIPVSFSLTWFVGMNQNMFLLVTLKILLWVLSSWRTPPVCLIWACVCLKLSKILNLMEQSIQTDLG